MRTARNVANAKAHTLLAAESDRLRRSLEPIMGGEAERADHWREGAVEITADAEFLSTNAKRVRLRRVEEALERLGSGVYGVCVECGERIAASRLAADLAAERCVSCQSVAEAAVPVATI